jgi:enoyl-CoA hydratase/3-hydroxyacyl-CoA dehydrogenase
MSYQYKELELSKISIIGAGNIGPDICLHFAKVFANDGVKLVLVDIAEQALESAQARIEKKIASGVEARAFRADLAQAMLACISYTTNYDNISGSSLVLEAATEDEGIKDAIFRQVDSICDNNTIFLSNSSHMRPEVIFRNTSNPGRCLVAHYFFPAERNPIIEIIPGADTDPALTSNLLGLYENIGKVPMEVASSYGYAIDPIFEGLFLNAILCLQKAYGTVKEIDRVSMDALGCGVGPVTAVTLAGGNEITDHGLDEMHTQLLPWFKSPGMLKELIKKGDRWDIASKGDTIEVSSEREENLRNQIIGAFFALASYIADLGICDISDLDKSCEQALVINPPFTMMNQMGIDKACATVQAWCAENEGFPMPKALLAARDAGGWKLSNVTRSTLGDVAVLTIKRPKVLNAVDTTVLAELREKFTQAENDPAIIGMVLTGFGVKAFVSGADINDLAACKTAEAGYQNSQNFQKVCNFVEDLEKPVVCAWNGFAFGGGAELAISCTDRVCRAGMPIAACQPEVNLGFIPGAGGSQRLPRLVGVSKAAEILRTARPVSSKEAVDIGLAREEVEGDLVEAAAMLVRQIADGSVVVTKIETGPLSGIGEPEELDIGHHSRKIDDILVNAIYQGAKMTLAEGLELESRSFGKCIETEDMWIGLDSFMSKGASAKANFIHR